MHPNAWRKIVCAHFPWNTLYFSQNSHFIFFHFLQIPFSLIQYPLWELFKVRISTTGHECKQQTKLNNSMYLCQNIIRADSENLFQWRGKGLQTLISRTQKLFAANYFLTTPPNLPPPHPALLAVTQIFHYQQNQQMSVELICDPVMDGENPPFATEWPPHLWTIVITTLLIVARWAGLIRKGGGFG